MNFLLTFLMLGILVLFAGPASATGQCEHLATVALSFDNGPLLPTVEVKVNGVVRRFLLDTGSDATMLSARFKNGAKRSAGSIGGFEGRARLGTVSLDSLAVGPIAEKRVTVPVELDDSVVSEHWDGILGADYLSKYDIEISYVGQQLVFHRANGCVPEWAPQGRNMPLSAGASPIPRIEVKAGQARTLAVVDTGASGSLIRAEFLRLAFPGHTVSPTRSKVAGFGEARSNMGTSVVGPLSIGSMQFDKLRMHVVMARNTADPDGLILGGDFFSDKRVFLSSSTRVLYYLPSAESGVEAGADFSEAQRLWTISLARSGNVHAQIKLAESADAGPERLAWQTMAASGGHVGSLVALAVHARHTGNLAQAKETIARALSSDPENYSALIERFLITQSQVSRNAAVTELAAAVQSAKSEPKPWQRDVFALLLGRLDTGKYVETLLAASESAAPKCAISAFLRELQRSGAWTSLDDADLRGICRTAKN